MDSLLQLELALRRVRARAELGDDIMSLLIDEITDMNVNPRSGVLMNSELEDLRNG